MVRYPESPHPESIFAQFVKLLLGFLWYSYPELTIHFNMTAASQMAQQMSQMNPQASGAGMFQPGQDPDKMFQSEAENLEVVEHWYILEGIEDRILATA